MKRLFNMKVAPKGIKKVLISEQSSNGFRSGSKLSPKAVEAKEAKEVEVVEEIVIVSPEAYDEVLEVLSEERVEVVPEEVVEAIDYSKLTNSELKAILDAGNVEYTATKKSELVELVEAM